MKTSTLFATVSIASLAVLGCEKKTPSPKPATPPAPAPAADDHAGHDHDHEHTDGHSHGAEVSLGSATIGGFEIKAVREGDVKPGGEVAIDLSIGGTAKPSAIRLWIGTEDAKGSIKAKAEAEGAGWHAHVEAPAALPQGAKLWIEVEAEGGAKSVGSLALEPAKG